MEFDWNLILQPILSSAAFLFFVIGLIVAAVL